MREPTRVGAFVRDERNRVFAHRRDNDRDRPGRWMMVGGRLRPGETPEEALAREVAEGTGWRLRRIEAVLGDWEGEHDGEVHRELDYLVDVEGDLSTPRPASHRPDSFTWIGPENLDLLLDSPSDGDRRWRDLAAKAARTRITDRLRLEPVGPEHSSDLFRLYQDPAVAAWYGSRLTVEAAERWAARGWRGWEAQGVDKWMAYHRHTGDLIGRGGLARTELDGRTWLEISWTVRSDQWGQGYATELGRAGLSFAFDELGEEAVVALTEAHNHRSRAVMRKLGMRHIRDLIRDGTPSLLHAVRRSAPAPPSGAPGPAAGTGPGG